jgi:hypothetical protein
MLSKTDINIISFFKLVVAYNRQLFIQKTYSFNNNVIAPHLCGFESRQGIWILSCEEAIQLAYGTSVVLLRYPFVPEIMHGRAHEVFLHQ